jgi:hypothetical protein
MANSNRANMIAKPVPRRTRRLADRLLAVVVALPIYERVGASMVAGHLMPMHLWHWHPTSTILQRRFLTTKFASLSNPHIG